MDPNLFYLDFERLFEVLLAIVVLAFLLERTLAVVFESRLFVEKLAGKTFKEPIAIAIGAIVCLIWDFDAISIIFVKDETTLLGAIITGGIVAGGSKASIKLFRDLMKVMSSAEAERQAAKKMKKAEVENNQVTADEQK